MKWIAIALVAIVAIVLVAVRVDYAFYNPAKGVAAAGRVEKAVDPHERELLRITVGDADIARFKGKVTLNALSDLYGTKDSLRCSVIKTYQNDNMAAANWNIQKGTPVTLCLN
ncbi:MAG TPA: hypothetical protein VFV49_17035 [Thermoanaerobaculia bacterium]|nr:hypothetical protein [Thermoanaerobaculia bacterium]